MADKGADADWLRVNLPNAGTVLVIPGERSRKPPIRLDNARYKDRWRGEAASCRLKDLRPLRHALRQARPGLRVSRCRLGVLVLIEC